MEGIRRDVADSVLDALARARLLTLDHDSLAFVGTDSNLLTITNNPDGSYVAQHWLIALPRNAVSLKSLTGAGSIAEAVPMGDGVLAASTRGPLVATKIRPQTPWTPVAARAVTSVAASPDGRMLAIGGADRAVQLWDATSRRLLATFTGHTDTVTALAFSGNGLLASGSADRSIRLWDTTRRTALGPALLGHRQTVRRLAFQADGGTLVSAAEDVVFWDLAGSRRDAHGSAVTAVALSGDRRLLASGDAKGWIRLWDGTARRPVGKPVRAHNAAVTAIAFDTQQRVATAGGDGTIQVWSTQDLSPIGPALQKDSNVTSLAFNQERFGPLALLSGGAGYVRLWKPDVDGYKSETLNVGKVTTVRQVAFGDEGSVLATDYETVIRLPAKGGIEAKPFDDTYPNAAFTQATFTADWAGVATSSQDDIQLRQKPDHTLSATDIAERAARFYHMLGDLSRTNDIRPDTFLAHKDALLAHLRDFHDELQRYTPRLREAVHAVEDTGLERMVEAAAEADERIFRTPVERLAHWRRRWAGLRSWLAPPSDDQLSEAERLADATISAIGDVLGLLRRVTEARRGGVSRESQLRHLAAWFTSVNSVDAAHALFDAAFGLGAPRHVSVGYADPESIPTRQSWWEAPAVELSRTLVEAGRAPGQGNGRPARVERSPESRARLREAQVARERRFAAAAGALAETVGEVPLDEPQTAVLLRLLDLVLAARVPGRRDVPVAAAAYGIRLTLTPAPGRFTAVPTARGTLYLDGFTLSVGSAGHTAAAARRELVAV